MVYIREIRLLIGKHLSYNQGLCLRNLKNKNSPDDRYATIIRAIPSPHSI
ncbi:MAG: hypothetical protein LBT22_03650 [Peptococcaceae bacterium]|nr:hypothetical protein [Peptococcaceae bacterium]